MKVLVAYFSQTGNTGKIAQAIYQEVSQANDAEIKKLGDVDPESLSEYACVFVGSPIHAGKIAKEVADVLETIPSASTIKLAGFITHAASAYPRQTIDDMSAPFEKACKDKGLTYKGCFNCQGYLADFMHEAVQKMQKADDDAWAEKIKQMTGHPNAEDEEKAKAFARSVLS